jgi:hypothetical protein
MCFLEDWIIEDLNSMTNNLQAAKTAREQFGRM